MRRTAGASTAAIVIATLAVTAQPREIAQDDSITLALLTQNFAIIAPNGVVHLEYELTGTIPEATSVATTIATTMATTTTAPLLRTRRHLCRPNRRPSPGDTRPQPCRQ